METVEELPFWRNARKNDNFGDKRKSQPPQVSSQVPSGLANLKAANKSTYNFDDLIEPD